MVTDAVTGKTRQIIVALDFDGVLHSYASGWTGAIPLDPPVPGAQEFCGALIQRGYKIVIFSTRAHPKLGKGPREFIDLARPNDDGSWENVGEKGVTLGAYAMRQWFRHHGFPAEVCNATITHKKEHADLFVDDRGFRFEGNYDEVLDYLLANPTAKPWTKQQ